MFEHVQITTLPNGAKIATSAMPGVNSCAIGINVEMGSRRERADQSGWSHFVEHMVFKGSAKRSSKSEIVRPLERIGGEYNAYTGIEGTLFETRVPAAHAATAFDVLGDMVARPLFPEGEIEKERKVVLEEIKRTFDNPAARVAQLARTALWPDHPLGRPVTGSPETLAPADAESLRAFHRSNYVSRGVLVVAAGNVEHDRIVDFSRSFLEALPDAPTPTSRPAVDCGPVVPISVERRDTKQAQLSVSFRCPGERDDRRFALALLGHVLGGGMSSRLFRAIREKEGLAYAIQSYPLMFSDAGCFQIRAAVDPARVETAVALCGRELKSVAGVSVEENELCDAKNLTSNALLLAGETSCEQRDLLEESLTMLGVVEKPEERAARFRAVTREEIRTLAADLFKPENCALALILPNDCKADPSKLREALFNG